MRPNPARRSTAPTLLKRLNHNRTRAVSSSAHAGDGLAPRKRRARFSARCPEEAHVHSATDAITAPEAAQSGIISPMAVTDKQIATCVAYYRKLLDARPDRPASLAQAPRSGLQKILHRAGAQRRSAGVLKDLEDAFGEASIVTYPRLTDRKNSADERIHFFARGREPDGVALPRQHFTSEASLRDFLLTNLHEFDQFRGLTGVAREKRMPSGRKLDILAKRARRGELVGIELKLGGINDRAVGQSLQYIDDLANLAAKQNFSAHYFLVAGGQPNPAGKQRIQRHADAQGVTLSILIHSVEMTLKTHP